MRYMKTVFLSIMILAALSYGHRMLLMIEDNEDGTIYVEAGLSTGNVPTGSRIIIKEKSTGRPLWQGKVPTDGKMNIKQPRVPYTVTLDAGAGHGVTQEGPLPLEKVEEPKDEVTLPPVEDTAVVTEDSDTVEITTEEE